MKLEIFKPNGVLHSVFGYLTNTEIKDILHNYIECRGFSAVLQIGENVTTFKAVKKAM